jgi:GAF domain-containing protein
MYLSFDNYGLVGDARLWLVFFSLFTTIMLGLRWGLLANLIGFSTFFGVGFMTIRGAMPIRDTLGIEYSLNPDSWITSGITLAFISLVLSFSIGLLIRSLEIGRMNLQTSFDENTELTSQIAEEQERLEKRSADLERRLVQIRTAAEISRSLGTILEQKELLKSVADLIQNRFDLYYVGVFLIDEFRRYAVLQAGTGEAGQTMITENHRLSVGGSSMVGWVTSHGQPRVSMDVDQEAIRFRNPHLPHTRSELAIPLGIGNQTIGAISVQSTQPNAFDDDDITVLQSIGDSLAIALENARLFQQFEHSLAEIQQLNRQYMSESWAKIWLDADKQGQQLTHQTGSLLNPDLAANEFDIPLTLRGDQVIGNISLSTDQKNLSTEEREFIRVVSDQAALALESARLLDEANKRVEQEFALQEITNRFARSLDFDQLLQTVVEELGQLPKVREASIHITPPDQLAQTSTDEQD